MPAPHAFRHGAPCWIDLMTSDQSRSVTFYTELLGWTADDPVTDFGGYQTLRKNGAPVAGVMAAQPGAGPDTWSTYLWTEDVAATLADVERLGGTTVVAPMPVGELGSMAVFTDPGGEHIGLWQPGVHRGFGLLAEPGAPCWFELLTHDYVGALSFYPAVFGVGTHPIGDEPEFRYTALTDGDTWLAGVMDGTTELAKENATGWGVVLGVADTDAALDRVVELGGSVAMPAMESPWGRLGMIVDPTGARVTLVDASPGSAAG